jgi:L-rhamnose mutarotase
MKRRPAIVVLAFSIIFVLLTHWAQGSEMIKSRHGSLIKIRPEYEERYIILHKHAFPGVLQQIHKVNIRNYSIFLKDGMLFSYSEYVGDDFDADMQAIADETTKEWWKLTDPMQEPLETRKAGEWWASMEPLFCLGKILKPSPGAQRIGVTGEVVSGKEEELKKLCNSFPRDLEELTYLHSFQNCNFFYKEGKVYYYYEYVGADLRRDITEMNQNQMFSSFQAELNKLLVPKDGVSLQVMKEVFHTD